MATRDAGNFSEVSASTARMFAPSWPAGRPLVGSIAMAPSSEPTDDRLLASYEQRHRILLVGEGDFSFTEALSDQLPSGQITASALDTEAELLQKYPAEIGARLARLRARGVVLRLGVDATTVELHHLVDGADDAAPAAGPMARKKFDRVVYNFPYAHVTKFCKEFREANLHLLRGFFARSAAMLADGGEVHVRNKTSQPYCGWNLQALLPPTLEAVGDAPFDPARFPGYANKSNWGGAARAYTVGSSPNPNPNPNPDPDPDPNPTLTLTLPLALALTLALTQSLGGQ